MSLKNFLLALLVLTKLTEVTAQKKLKAIQLGDGFEMIKTPLTTCYKTDEVHHHYVPPKTQKRSSNVPGVQLNFSYSEGMPQQVITIFEEFIGPTLSETFTSNIPINVSVSWERLQSASALAAAGPNGLIRGRNGLPKQWTWYPIALAEKLLNKEMNEPDEADIVVLISSEQDWYFDYANPGGVGNRFDLASTLLHEIYHGLGFNGLETIDDDGNGFIRFGGSVNVYMNQLESRIGTKLTDIEDGTTQMARALTGNDLFFGSPSFVSADRPRIYAPFTYSSTSSIGHLDESTYNNTPSSLMTPSSARGEVERSAGIADDILYDIGWSYTSIVYETGDPEENVTDPFEIAATIVSDNEVDESSVTLHYFENGEDPEVTVPMSKGPDDFFRAEIPATGEERFVLYYISVKDINGTTYTNPGESPSEGLYRYDFAIDNTDPEIDHEPVTKISTVDPSFFVSADVTDFFTGLETVQVEFAINKRLQDPVDMTLESLNEFTLPVYQAVVEIPGGSLQESDILEYRIVAVDKSNAANKGTSPANGFHIVTVDAVAAIIESYGNDFDADSEDFFENGLSIRTPTGFTNRAIHSQHPYPNAGADQTIDWTYQLKFPVRVSESDPNIRFDEIVLVENGEPGAAYGTLEFWDYVVVEGQKLGSRDWIPFIDGYDCRANPVWLNTYLGGIPQGQQDSGSEGRPELFRPRTINMVRNGDFTAGDEIFIRFRMFSDPFAVGWGWAIDNLRIQRESVAVEDFVNESDFSISPNPVIGNEISIALNLKKRAPDAIISITDITGKLIYNQRANLPSNQSVHKIEVSDLTQGVYFVSVQFNKDDIITRKVVK